MEEKEGDGHGKDALTGVLREAVQTHSLVQKTDDNGDIHKGYCTDAVYAGSMDAAGEKLCEKLTDNLPLSPALVSIYRVRSSAAPIPN